MFKSCLWVKERMIKHTTIVLKLPKVLDVGNYVEKQIEAYISCLMANKDL